MRYYIIAGEASGDLHAANLMQELKTLDPQAVFRCWGGDRMQQQGGELVRHYRDLAFMGFLEVVAHLPVILRNLSFCERDIRQFNPDTVILVDYPGFNLRVAKFARKAGYRVVYYISPQLWAWRPTRVKIIRENVDRMFVILPFETAFYDQHGYHVDYVGHPLLDVINNDLVVAERAEFLNRNKLDQRQIIALLPGSRKMEIANVLERMICVRKDFADYQFVVAGAPSQEDGFYQELLKGTGISYVRNQTYDLLHHSKAALVTSGTATLETALLGVPQIVCYRGNPLSYLIARQLVNISYISLVNLICGKAVVPELIQQKFNQANLTLELNKILNDQDVRQNMLDHYRGLQKILGGRGASSRTAAAIMQYLTLK